MTESEIVSLTKKWIEQVVIGFNFCPFAAKEFKNETIHYHVETDTDLEACLKQFFIECERLDGDESIETTLLILPNAVKDFRDYLDLVGMAEQLLAVHDYEGVYQVATFHPAYLFAGSNEDDAANYTNRSPFPIIQILREESIEKALERFPDPDKIPERNIKFARNKGLEFMRKLIR
jgi:hypothetical protein